MIFPSLLVFSLKAFDSIANRLTNIYVCFGISTILAANQIPQHNWSELSATQTEAVYVNWNFMRLTFDRVNGELTEPLSCTPKQCGWHKSERFRLADNLFYWTQSYVHWLEIYTQFRKRLCHRHNQSTMRLKQWEFIWIKCPDLNVVRLWRHYVSSGIE